MNNILKITKENNIQSTSRNRGSLTTAAQFINMCARRRNIAPKHHIYMYMCACISRVYVRCAMNRYNICYMRQPAAEQAQKMYSHLAHPICKRAACIIPKCWRSVVNMCIHTYILYTYVHKYEWMCCYVIDSDKVFMRLYFLGNTPVWHI